MNNRKIGIVTFKRSLLFLPSMRIFPINNCFVLPECIVPLIQHSRLLSGAQPPSSVFKTILLTVTMIAALSIGGCRNAMAMPQDLSQFQWKNRLLLLFAPSRSHPSFDTLYKSLEARKAETADRDLVIFEILESEPSSMGATRLEAGAAQALREKFDIFRGRFAVILIGKDGGIKLKRQDQTQLEDIFAVIDAMPMRQQEMQQKSRTGLSGAAKSNDAGAVK